MLVLFLSLTTLISAQWVELNPTTVPPARTVAAFTQITTGALLFGGSGKGLLSDTWVFTGNNWHDMSTLGVGSNSAIPPARCLTAMAAYKNGAVLFGGYGNTVKSMSDTWVWNPTDGWQELNLAVAPPGRSYHAMQAIPGGVLLFGGTNRSSESHDTAFGDTWLFNGTWHNLELLPPNAPSPRWGHGLACTPPTKNNKTNCVLFGGAGLSEDDHFDDTWVITENGWQQSQPGNANLNPKPYGRWSFQLAPCGAGALMATGSVGYRICSDDTWTFNATVFESPWGIAHTAIGEWSQEKPSIHPTHLGGAMLSGIDDKSSSGVLLFGGIEFHAGSTNVGPVHNDTWFWPTTSCPS